MVTLTLTDPQIAELRLQICTPVPGKLYFSYFGGMEDEIFASENMVFATTWGWNNTPAIVDGLQRAKASGVEAAIVVMDYLVYSTGNPRRYLGKAAADANCRTFFDALQHAGLLGMVKALYPADEPERDANIPADQIIQCNTNLRALAKAYPELSGVKIAVIYGDGHDYRGIVSYDWIGVDAYQYGAGILTSIYPGLLAQMSTNQKLILVPGGADPWHADIQPFYDYALSNRVALIAPFIWVDQWGGTANLGIHGNGNAQPYNAVALQIRNG